MHRLTTTVVPLAAAESMGRAEQGFIFDGALLGKRRRTRVRGTINGHEFATGANPLGDGRYFVFINAEMRARMGVGLGDTIEVEFEEETARPEVAVPDDLAAALAEAGLSEAFAAMAWSHRKRYVEVVNEAKQPATRARRIARTIEAVAAGRGAF